MSSFVDNIVLLSFLIISMKVYKQHNSQKYDKADILK